MPLDDGDVQELYLLNGNGEVLVFIETKLKEVGFGLADKTAFARYGINVSFIGKQGKAFADSHPAGMEFFHHDGF
jgi:hypothetical protein